MQTRMETEVSDPGEIVRAFPFLRQLPPEELLALNARRVERRAGAPFFLQGSPGDAVYGILTGRLKIVKQAPGGGELCLELLGPGELVAAVAVIRRLPMPASSVPLEATACVRIGADEFRQVLARHPEISARILDTVAKRLLEAGSSRVELATQEVPARLARALLRLASRFGAVRGSEVVFTQTITRQNLADLAGTTVESAIRVMSRWTREGLVRSSDSRITILKKEELERIAEAAPH